MTGQLSSLLRSNGEVTAWYVVEHAKARKRRGKQPSMAYLGEKNPRKALAIAVKETQLSPKDKFAYIESFMPGYDEVNYSFARFLGDRLHDTIKPEGVILAANLAIYDLQKGVNGYTNQPIRSSLVGYPAIIYRMLSMAVPAIVEAVYPPDFVAKFNASWADFQANVAAVAATPKTKRDKLMDVATALVEKSNGRAVLAFQEQDDSNNPADDAAHFIKVDGRRIGRDIELYGFMGDDVMGWEQALVQFMEEVLLRFQSLGMLESYKAGAELLKEMGKEVYPADLHDRWVELF